MGDRHDYVALEWVKGEIAETLKQARQALEAYVESPADPTQMGFCLTYVHQVHGTLQMVEFFGAALLAEEMEQLARALLEERVANRTESLEVLMQSILQLPAYLDRIQSARRDLPMVVLPLLNDLRAARGEKLLSETSLFAPDLSSRLPALPRESVERRPAGVAAQAAPDATDGAGRDHSQPGPGNQPRLYGKGVRPARTAMQGRAARAALADIRGARRRARQRWRCQWCIHPNVATPSRP